MEAYSVLQTVYRGDNPDYLRQSLLSMLGQTRTPDEIVLVKDGPLTAELEEGIASLEAAYPGVLRPLALEKNLGLGLALNEGLKVCRNEFVARMDSDDISLPERCEKELALFEQDPELAIVGCPVLEFSGSPDNILGRRDVPLDNDAIHRYARRRDPFNHPAVIYRKSEVLRCGPYGDYRKNQDTALWIDMLSKGCKAANCPEALLLFRFDENTYRKRKSLTNTRLLLRIRRQAYQKGFGSLSDYLAVCAGQTALFLLPASVQKFVYTRFLRKKK